MPSPDAAVQHDVPLVSVIVANYNGARFVETALASVLAQTLREIEVLFVDDGSTDDSVARVTRIAERDPRVRMLRTPANGGPAVARNVALDVAAGQWLAVMDSDDLMHPDRLTRLVAAAERDDADIVADDLLVFDEDDRVPPFWALGTQRRAFWIDTVTYVRGNFLFDHGPAIGYLKPLFRASMIHRTRLRYDPMLRIAEDYDFVLRLLSSGARFRVCPEPTYFYRKHTASISHRLSRRTLLPMMAAHDSFRAGAGSTDPQLSKALDERRDTISRALDFDAVVTAVKQRRWRTAVGIAIRRPRVVAMLRMPLLAGVGRMFQRPARPPKGNRGVCIVSRQPVAAYMNGDSAYLLSLAAALLGDGFDVHLVCPSPEVFARSPLLLLRGEKVAFRSVRIRGGWRFGQAIVARDPRVLGAAALTLFDRLPGRRRFSSDRPATPESRRPDEAWSSADLLFVARHARRDADVILVDQLVLTGVIPYVLRPDAISAVVACGLPSRRSACRDETDPRTVIERAREGAFPGQADAIIAIGADEAKVLRRRFPGKRVIVAPMTTVPAELPQPGVDGKILCVGEATEANILGLRWFIDCVWPDIRRAMPDAGLTVAGGVVEAFTSLRINGVRFAGEFTDLTTLYAQAAVVILPQREGTGSRIQLIEALGHGKAIVATIETMRDIEPYVHDAVRVSGDPGGFATGVVGLLRDMERRFQLGQAALDMARRHFSAPACHGDFLKFAAGFAPNND
jgi:GT2 family glycosyltransferase/glycosyltransferase involved in cell wall biosynthesis